MNERQRIADNIANYAKWSGKTKVQIAKEIGTSETLISHYVYGQKIPTILTLRKLCKSLDCSYEDILGAPSLDE